MPEQSGKKLWCSSYTADAIANAKVTHEFCVEAWWQFTLQIPIGGIPISRGIVKPTLFDLQSIPTNYPATGMPSTQDILRRSV